jgi:hypothetical protein
MFPHLPSKELPNFTNLLKALTFKATHFVGTLNSLSLTNPEVQLPSKMLEILVI